MKFFLVIIIAAFGIYYFVSGSSSYYGANAEIPRKLLKSYDSENAEAVMGLINTSMFKDFASRKFPNVDYRNKLSFGIEEERGTEGHKFIFYVEMALELAQQRATVTNNPVNTITTRAKYYAQDIQMNILQRHNSRYINTKMNRTSPKYLCF